HGPALAAFTGRPTPPESCVSASPTLPPADGPARGLTLTQWLIVVLAAIGFAFDIYELLMLPLILRPAILELGTVAPSAPAVAVPAFAAAWWGPIAPEDQHEPWRYTFLSRLIPAIPLVLIRPFLPESPVWQRKKTAGTLKRPSVAELFTPAYLRTTLLTTL